jgi:predicted nucleic acid-binding protein
MADGLLDTTVFIDFYNGDQGAFDVVRPVLEGASTGSYCPVSVFEIWLGIREHEQEVRFTAILSALQPAPLTDQAAITAAQWLRGVSPRRAENLFRDALIAATAAQRGEPVVTRNVNDFKQFPVDVRSY